MAYTILLKKGKKKKFLPLSGSVSTRSGAAFATKKQAIFVRNAIRRAGLKKIIKIVRVK